LADDVELQILGCCCFLDRSVSRVARKSWKTLVSNDAFCQSIAELKYFDGVFGDLR
jgi:hypothetical protein